MAAVGAAAGVGIAAAAQHRETVSGGEAGKDLGGVLKASKKGEAGDAEKNSAIVKMVDDFKKTGASDAECAQLTKSLQSSGTSGQIHGKDAKVVMEAMKKINEV